MKEHGGSGESSTGREIMEGLTVAGRSSAGKRESAYLKTEMDRMKLIHNLKCTKLKLENIQG